MGEYQREEQMQEDHFNAIADRYGQHYGDKWSQAYRYRFLNEPMFRGLNLKGKKVLDAICGNGETAGYLLEQGAIVTGLDISQEAIANYRKQWPQCKTRCASIMTTGLEVATFDCVVVVGGLHHLHPYVVDAVEEIRRILKPGGYFCFVEPHKGSLPDRIRRIWYKRDDFFANNEEAVDIENLKEQFVGNFDFRRQNYTGNLAYLFVLNSMIFRMPLKLKSLYSPLLLKIEALIDCMQGRRWSCISICQWQKTPLR